MQRADAEHAGVGAHGADEVDGRRADRDLGALVQPAADHEHLGGGVVGQRSGDRRRVRQDGAGAARRAGGGRPRGWWSSRRAAPRARVAEHARRPPRRARPSRPCTSPAGGRRSRAAARAAARRRARAGPAPGPRARAGRAGSCPPTRRAPSTSRAATTLPSRRERREDRLPALGAEQLVVHVPAWFCTIATLLRWGRAAPRHPARRRIVCSLVIMEASTGPTRRCRPRPPRCCAPSCPGWRTRPSTPSPRGARLRTRHGGGVRPGCPARR